MIPQAPCLNSEDFYVDLRAAQQYDHWATNTIVIKTAKLVLLSRVSLGKVVEQERFQLSAVPPQGANSVSAIWLWTTITD